MKKCLLLLLLLWVLLRQINTPLPTRKGWGIRLVASKHFFIYCIHVYLGFCGYPIPRCQSIIYKICVFLLVGFLVNLRHFSTHCLSWAWLFALLTVWFTDQSRWQEMTKTADDFQLRAAVPCHLRTKTLRSWSRGSIRWLWSKPTDPWRLHGLVNMANTGGEQFDLLLWLIFESDDNKTIQHIGPTATKMFK